MYFHCSLRETLPTKKQTNSLFGILDESTPPLLEYSSVGVLGGDTLTMHSDKMYLRSTLGLVSPRTSTWAFEGHSGFFRPRHVYNLTSGFRGFLIQQIQLGAGGRGV